MQRFEGKTVLITGGAGMLGGVLAQKYVAQGARVILASRFAEHARKACEPFGDQALPLVIDLEVEDSIRNAAKRFGQDLPAPEILVANASQRDVVAKSFEELDKESFERLLAADLVGHVLLARAWAEYLPKTRSASLLFLSSIYAEAGVDRSIYPEGWIESPIHYASAKGGIESAVRMLAAKWGKEGIRVNAITAGGFRKSGPAVDEEEADFLDRYGQKTMLGRMGRPEEIAEAALFLTSEAASYITGVCLPVDGGFLAW